MMWLKMRRRPPLLVAQIVAVVVRPYWLAEMLPALLQTSIGASLLWTVIVEQCENVDAAAAVDDAT